MGLDHVLSHIPCDGEFFFCRVIQMIGNRYAAIGVVQRRSAPEGPLDQLHLIQLPQVVAYGCFAAPKLPAQLLIAQGFFLHQEKKDLVLADAFFGKGIVPQFQFGGGEIRIHRRPLPVLLIVSGAVVRNEAANGSLPHVFIISPDRKVVNFQNR